VHWEIARLVLDYLKPATLPRRPDATMVASSAHTAAWLHVEDRHPCTSIARQMFPTDPDILFLSGRSEHLCLVAHSEPVRSPFCPSVCRSPSGRNTPNAAGRRIFPACAGDQAGPR
jgi:hypothetical protein